MNSNRLFYSISRQIESLFGFSSEEKDILNIYLPEAIDRTLYCFSHINNKYFQKGEINPLHSVQYTQFLYYCANTICRRELRGNSKDNGAADLCSKLYMLNKALSACEIFYEVDLPDIFLLEHPVGTVMGRGKFSDYFFFLQNCTVGANDNLYPEFGERVIMLAGSKVLGTCHIGNNVIISANTYVKDEDIPDDCIVFGSSPNLTIKPGHKDKIDAMINENFIL